MILARTLRRPQPCNLLQSEVLLTASANGRRSQQNGSRKSILALGSAAACAVMAGGVISNYRQAHCRESVQDNNSKVLFFPQSKVGSGSFGTVRLGKFLESNENVAVKIVQENQSTQRVLESEVQALQKIQSMGGHRNIVEYICCMQQPKGSNSTPVVPLADWLETSYSSVVSLLTGENRSFSVKPVDPSLPDDASLEKERWLLFEHVKGKELYDAVIENGRFQVDEARSISMQIASAIKFLHEKVHIAHGDIKPENILLSENGTVKVIDFGSSLPLKNPGESDVLESKLLSISTVGTAAYCAPEILQKASDLTTAIDVWALGCVLYILISGSHPFDPTGRRTDSAVMAAVSVEEPLFEESVWRTTKAAMAKDLIQKMLEKDPTNRATLDQVMIHPFFQL